jgi:VanZ family protein
MAFIFALSSISQTPALPGNTDKGAHTLLYAGIGALLVRALAGGWGRRVTAATALLAMMIGGVYGISDEVHQYFVPPRQSDVMDVMADFVGAGLAAWSLYARSAIAGRGRPPTDDV